MSKVLEKNIDLVCGMTISSNSKIYTEIQSQKYFFCSNYCKLEFIKNPNKYLTSKSTKQRPSTLSKLATYYPLLLIFLYLTGVTFVSELSAENYDLQRIMRHFMAGFFLIFSFFKFLNLRSFSEAYQTYDLIARVFPLYSWVYPFIELVLGAFYFTGIFSRFTNLTTLILMTVSSVGVARSLASKNQIQCVCLGTVFKLPMTTITLFENLLMAVMALMGLVQV